MIARYNNFDAEIWSRIKINNGFVLVRLFYLKLKEETEMVKKNVVDWETITNFVIDAFVGYGIPRDVRDQLGLTQYKIPWEE